MVLSQWIYSFWSTWQINLKVSIQCWTPPYHPYLLHPKQVCYVIIEPPLLYVSENHISYHSPMTRCNKHAPSTIQTTSRRRQLCLNIVVTLPLSHRGWLILLLIFNCSILTIFDARLDQDGLIFFKECWNMVKLFFKLKSTLAKMTILFEAETLSEEWPVVLICGKKCLANKGW